MPKARQLIMGASFDPEELEMITAVFEEIWMSVSASYGAKDVDAARLRLATLVLNLAGDGQLSPVEIARTGARLMREEHESTQRWAGISLQRRRR
jgi:hypothetical protein